MDKKIELQNAKEEISELLPEVKKCIGLCKEIDPVYQVLKQEDLSIRGMAILLSEDKIDSSVFDSPLSGSAITTCPFCKNIDQAIRKIILEGENPFIKKED